MNPRSWSVPGSLAVLLLTALGLIGLRESQVRFLDADRPTIQIWARLRGAAPPGFEIDVARRIENYLASLDRLDRIVTTIAIDSVLISVSFDGDKDGEVALGEVRNAVNSVCVDLPASAASASASLDYTIESVPRAPAALTLSAVAPKTAAWLGLVRGDCRLAAGQTLLNVQEHAA